MKPKRIDWILPPPVPRLLGDGCWVHNFFPGGYNISGSRTSPFFLLDYIAKRVITPSLTKRGVRPHPDRGFETVTIAYHGQLAHHDSGGNRGVIRAGDVQWMTAAPGILHQECYEESFSRTGGPFQMVQLWVNLPARFKMSTPNYQTIQQAAMGRYELPGSGGVVEVIAGEFRGVSGPAHTFSPIQLYNVHLPKAARLTLRLPEADNTSLLVIDGVVTLNGTDYASADHFVLFTNEGESIALRAEQDSTLLVLSGEPLNEPIAAYGPFLMNTPQELQQALADFQQGRFDQLNP